MWKCFGFKTMFLYLKIHEKEIYAQRQSILEEIEILRKREAEVKRSSEGNERFVILHRCFYQESDEEGRNKSLVLMSLGLVFQG
jgi:hypothetical protein